MPGPWDWLTPTLIGAGASLGGAALQSRAVNKGNELNQQYSDAALRQAEQERQRRDELTRMIMPNMMRDLGMKPNPQMLQHLTRGQQLGSLYGNSGNPSQGGMSAAPAPPLQPSGASKALNIARTGLGAAGGLGALGALGKGAGAIGTLNPATGALSAAGAKAGGVTGALGLGGGSGLFGLGALTVPVIGGALAAAAYGANQIGKGRRTANLATNEGGFERQFDDAMGEAARRRDAGDVEGARQVLQQGYNTFMQGIQAFQAKGGNHAKVAEQAMNQNPIKWQTFEEIKKSLGM